MTTTQNDTTSRPVIEVRFKGNRAFIWNNPIMRWTPIGAEKARLMVETGEATDLTDTDYI